MSNASHALAVTAVLLLAGCAAPDAIISDPLGQPASDWIAVDRGLARGPLHRYAHWFCDEPAEQLAARRAALRFTSAGDSLGLNELPSRPLTEQRRRRDDAVRLLGEAMLIIQGRAEHFSTDGVPPWADHLVFEGLQATLDKVLVRLHTAVGTDPGNADAWAALAYFSAVIGDERTAGRARRAYLEQAVTADARGRARTARVVLDEAWALREAGHHDRCQRWLDAHRGLLDAAPPAAEALPPRLERDLIAALMAAESGDRLGTRRRINRLPLVPVRQRSGDRDSDYLRTWVRAWLELASGDRAAAAQALTWSAPGRLHTAVDWRFWQDLGHIAEACGLHGVARNLWGNALRARPYPGFHPRVVLQGPADFLGYPNTDAAHAVSYRTHRLVGSAWGFAATRALLCLDDPQDDARPPCQEAMDALDRCIDRDDHPGAARLLRSRLLLQRGDVTAAAAELRDPTVRRLAAGSLAMEVARLRAAADPLAQPRRLSIDDDRPTGPRRLATVLGNEDVPPQTLLGDTPDERAMWLRLLDERHRRQATPEARRSLAEAHGAAGDHPAVRQLLAAAWPEDLTPSERLLVLRSDRAMGDPTRARQIATAPADWLDPALVMAAVITLRNADDRGTADQLLAFARQRWPGNHQLDDLARPLP